MKDPIFLSSSIPNREPYVRNSDPIAIREAILALVSVAIPERELVFGGHPAISPLVEQAAHSLGNQDNVHIFQSKWFEKKIPPEAQRFQNFHWTAKAKTQATSLKRMREQMMHFRPFCAGIFIGGMEGVEDECQMFKLKYPDRPVFPIASTLGAAFKLWDGGEGPSDAKLHSALHNEKHYRSLFRQLLS